MSTLVSPSEGKVVIERNYRATIEDVWALWTTKEGFESWWGPQGFHGSPEMVAMMKQMGQPPRHATRSEFTEEKAHARLVLTSIIDFLPGVAAYESNIAVDFIPAGNSVRMVVTLDAMHSDAFTIMQKEAFTSQLRKLDKHFA